MAWSQIFVAHLYSQTAVQEAAYADTQLDQLSGTTHDAAIAMESGIATARPDTANRTAALQAAKALMMPVTATAAKATFFVTNFEIHAIKDPKREMKKLASRGMAFTLAVSGA